MIALANGQVAFNDIYELYYHLFLEIGLSTDANDLLLDQDTGAYIKFKDKFIKATVVPKEIYSGKNDILFEPDKNYQLISMLTGYYIDKEASMGNDIGFQFISVYDNPTRDKQQVTIKSVKFGPIESNFYYNVYLGYIECIFRLSQSYYPNLDNLDIPPERK
jgi:hypothetical protein